MPLPFLIAGGILAAVVGVKKGIDAKQDFDEAKSVNKEAQNIYDEARNSLNRVKNNVNTSLTNLGEAKVTIYGNLTVFANSFAKIKNIDFNHSIAKDVGVMVSKESMRDLEVSILKINEVLIGGATALGAGGLAGLGAFGGVGLLATASTGTAISGLAGAAATNATLAWLGGGSLAAGGMGMAGGMAVLGGIVAGPVLAVGGLIMAAKAETAKHEAYTNYNKAKADALEMDAARTVLNGIFARVQEMSSTLIELNKIFVPYVNRLTAIVTHESTDYALYSNEDKKFVMVAASIAQTLKHLCDTPVLNEKGAIEQASKNVINQARNLLEKIESV